MLKGGPAIPPTSSDLNFVTSVGAMLAIFFALGRFLAAALDIPPLSGLSKEVWRPHSMMTCPGFLALAVRLLWTVVLALAAPQKG